MSSSPETVRILRVFVSSPGDVKAERESLDEVVASINRTEGRSHGVRLELFRWEEHVTPQIGPQPQAVIDQQTPVYDIYIGIMSKRFGTRTGRHGSGTEREFKDALKQWKQAGSPWIIFYFDAAPQLSGDPAEVEQYLKVCQFRKSLEKKGIVATYKGVRGSRDSFYEKASDHLREIVQRFVAAQSTEAQPQALPPATECPAIKTKILFLASLPDDQSRIRLDKEYREIEARLRSSDYRDHFELVSRWAVRARDLQEVLLRERPHIVHFSGHGSAAEELILEDDAGNTKPVSKKALSVLFRILKDNILAVVLNACFSQPQAEAIAAEVGCAVGMKQAIGDHAAIEFASAFYQALGYGRSIQTAFDLGCNALQVLGIPEENTPMLLTRAGAEIRMLQVSEHAISGRSATAPAVPREYTEWLLARCGEVELMGLELKHGSGVRLNHVYTPLTTSSGPPRRILGRTQATERVSRQLLLDLLNEQSLYVSGDPGAGKSTFCRWVTWLTCNGSMPDVDIPAPDECQEVFPGNLRDRLPVLVRLRDFWQHLLPSRVRSMGLGGVERALQSWLEEQRYPGLDWSCLKAHLDRGSALLMLDGVDEVPPVRKDKHDDWYPREMLLAGLAEAIARWTGGGNRLLVTSRPYGLNSEQRRKLGLSHAPILGLDQAFQSLLVRRWFTRLKEDRKLGLETAATMIDHIHVERGLDDLAANPLLLTAMCIIYDEGKRLPHDKYLLYDRIVDTVLHKRYTEKELIEPVRARLAAVAFGMHTGEGLGEQRATPEASATDVEVDRLLQSYHRLDGSTDEGLTDTVKVREDLFSQSGLLVTSGDDRASFYHLSLQEFLAAERLFVLHGQNQAALIDLLVSRGQTPGWRNTLAFLFGCLVATFKAHSGVKCLQEVTRRMVLPERPQRVPDGVWSQAIVLGDCLQILTGRGATIEPSLISFFQKCVFHAIEQEITVKDRQTLAVALGRLGDSRVAADLRVTDRLEDHPGYVRVPAGEYVYGDEKKPYRIDEPYWLSKYPVTNSQYGLFISVSGYARKEFWSEEGWQWLQEQEAKLPPYWRNAEFNAPTQPVVTVSWWEADAFCRWAGGLLPTERQWEAAARGPQGHEYTWGGEWENGICNSAEAGLESTSAVGIFPRGRSEAFGLEDMAGNVWEWCADLRERGATGRVFRGGSWWYGAGRCRAAFRYWSGPQYRDYGLGFRVAAVPANQ